MEQFEYLGHRFKVVRMLRGDEDSGQMMPRPTPEGYTHHGFYEAASAAGQGNADVFLMNNKTIVVPCDYGFRWFLQKRGRKAIADKKVPLRFFIEASIIEANGGEEAAKAVCIAHLKELNGSR